MALPGINTSLPPEIDAEQQRIARQQAVAEAMLQRGMTPLATNQGPIHWTQGLAQMFNAYTGRRGIEDASQARKGVGQQYQQGLADEVKRIAALRRGQTIVPDPQEIEQASDQGTAMPTTKTTGDPRAAIEAALLSQYEPVRQMGVLEHKTFENEQTKKGDREARLHERILALDAAAANQALAREERTVRAKEAADLRRELAEMQDETRRAIAGSRSSVNVHPAVTVTEIVRDGKVIKIDARTGRELGESPKESDAQKRENKRQFNMQGIGATIAEAEAILSNKANPPTGSGFGNIVDKVGGFFGATPDGAAEAEKLRAVGGALVSKMPRMEGPQSDKDVALYKEMAGMVGDASIPIERRVAALEEVKKLWAKYERLNPDAFAPAGGSDGWSVVR